VVNVGAGASAGYSEGMGSNQGTSDAQQQGSNDGWSMTTGVTPTTGGSSSWSSGGSSSSSSGVSDTHTEGTAITHGTTDTTGSTDGTSHGTNPEQALSRAASLPGPLSGLLQTACDHAEKTGRPLFSRQQQGLSQPVAGALVEVFGQLGLLELRAFALQFDEVASKGVDAPELLNDAARTLAREYRDRVLAEKEQLGGRLTTTVAFYFFFPAILLILAAFLLPMLTLFNGGQ
jgi:hypothetical protein